MAENNTRKDQIIDYDELDELPDVVLGEQTLAMRKLRENGKPVIDTKPKQQSKQNKALDEVNVYDQTTGIPSVEELLKQKIEQTEMAKADSAQEKTVVLEKTVDDDLHLEELKKGQKYRNGTRIDYLGNEVEIEDFNPNTARYKIVDNGRTKWVTDKNLKLIDPEIPVSLQDEDPGVNDELSPVLEEENQETKAIPLETKNENINALDSVYTGTASVPKHARTTKQRVIPTTPVPFEELYKEAFVSSGETDEERAIRMKKRKTTPMIQKIVTVIIVVLLAILCAGVYLIYSGLQPVTSTSEEVKFMVEDGSTVKDVAKKLQEENIIKNADVAYTYARLNHLTDVKQGLFTLDKSWGIKQMFTYLNDQNAARRDQVSVTVIEGDWAKDAAKKFSEVTNVSSEDLLALWNNKDWIVSQKEKYPFLTDDMFKSGVRIYLEGYLAPDTYYVNKETTAEEITTTLLDQSLTILISTKIKLHQVIIALRISIQWHLLFNMKLVQILKILQRLLLYSITA